MQKLFLVIATVLIASILLFHGTAGQGDRMLAPPRRPMTFSSADELRSYLKALNEYYSIVGRPRFGRSVNKRSLDSDLFEGEDIGADEYPMFDEEAGLYL